MNVLRSLLNFLGMTLPALLLAALVAIVMADVLARNFFGMSIQWAQELAVVLLGATVWLGLSGAAMQGQLFGISLFVDRLPARAAIIAQLMADLVMMLIALRVIQAAVAQIATARFTTFLTLGWPKWIMAVLLATGMALILVGRIVQMVDSFGSKRA